MQKKLNIGIIGAGLSGLCASKYAKQSGHSVTVFEQSDRIGGTWNYTDATGQDKYGLDIHTSMYHNLYTNLPKEIMEFRDCPMPSSPRSYIASDEFLSYLHLYADRFDLVALIKFNYYVIRVRPIEDTKWEVIVKNLREKSLETHSFDAIIVCNGHYSVPNIPKFSGIDLFAGRKMHSHDYRRANSFQDKTVLVIGSGPSGIDLVMAISQTAKKVLFSHHTHDGNHRFAPNVIKKGRIKEFTATGVRFADDDTAEEMITDVLYCTGYKYKFPCLSADCDIHVDNNFISPLYKHCININYPTMAVIGCVFTAAITQLIDIQVRFYMAYLNGTMALPPPSEMFADTERQLNKRRALGWPMKKAHSIAGEFQREYFADLSQTANIPNVREIYLRIYDDSSDRRHNEPTEYRNDIYTIIDEEQFERGTLVKSGII